MRIKTPFICYAAFLGLASLVGFPAESFAANTNASSHGSLLELPPAPGSAQLPAPAAQVATPVAASGAPLSGAAGATPPPTPAPAPVLSPVNPVPAAAVTAPSPLQTQASPPAGGPAASMVAIQPASMPGHTEAPLSPAEAFQQQQAAANVLTKNPDVVFSPTHLGPDVSLMFKPSDTKVINEALAVYDKATHAQAGGNTTGEDDFSSLLSSFKKPSDDPAAAAHVPDAPPPLPNIYLGSLVYYSPGNWSVWINGMKLTNRNNKAGNEFRVTRLSREEVELVWKPASLVDTPALWLRLTENGAHPLPHVSVNEKQGTITMSMRPNQTFLPHTLAIREGLIKSSHITAVATPAEITMPPGTPGSLSSYYHH